MSTTFKIRDIGTPEYIDSFPVLSMRSIERSA